MKLKGSAGMWLAGIAAGTINGLLGAGGGMVLVPLLTHSTPLNEDEVFPASVSIILPICIASLCMNIVRGNFPWHTAWPYLIGSAIGGFFAGTAGRKIPTIWLHRALGLLILWGGLRHLC